ncbi:pyrroline-5-carboxylate reductase [Alteribacillus persepolensis]|uniref:Pyrroline-5-carboxylate reductase n=1 Tax=Alteribacillus persepolensis TaxID=568899 RepID=A0A1G7YCL8_9BACI|nr:pyrroline-5-carboxylate reductase [Alteribacillus persepolensis]SDG94292.1 pyrroline-5-carboxylate reductase [Alteribacillus persepolensis]
MLENKTLAFIGAGSMAESIIGGLLSEQLVSPEQIVVTNKSQQQRLDELQKRYDVQTTSSNKAAVEKADIVILAFKPKHAAEGISTIKGSTTDKHLIISVLAGLSTGYIEQLFEKETPVIRAMPNTSSKVNASATALCKGYYTNAYHLDMSSVLFQAIGTVTTIEESKMDAVTGISGSGPAYFYYLVEAMQTAATEAGLPDKEAKELIVQTLHGAAKRLQQTEKTPHDLYQEVMSPGGTTEAAFTLFKHHRLQEHFQEGIQEAINRSKELGASTKSPLT